MKTNRLSKILAMIFVGTMILGFASCKENSKNPLKGHTYFVQIREDYSAELRFISENEVEFWETKDDETDLDTKGSYKVFPDTLRYEIYSGSDTMKGTYTKDGSEVVFDGVTMKKIK